MVATAVKRVLEVRLVVMAFFVVEGEEVLMVGV